MLYRINRYSYRWLVAALDRAAVIETLNFLMNEVILRDFPMGRPEDSRKDFIRDQLEEARSYADELEIIYDVAKLQELIDSYT